MVRADIKDLSAGTIFIAIGVLFTTSSLIDLEMGTAFRMGPGFYPLVLGVILICLGIAIAFTSLGRKRSPAVNVPWRGMVLIPSALILFGAAVRPLGLVPALVAAILISAYANRRMNAMIALSLAAGLTIFCVLVFKYALGLPLQLFGRMLGG